MPPQVVDACPKGNLSRFLNHSERANCWTRVTTVRTLLLSFYARHATCVCVLWCLLRANCWTRITTVHHNTVPSLYNRTFHTRQVRGDQRIGIYARRRISVGEELAFDYRYDTQVSANFLGEYPPTRRSIRFTVL